MSFTQDTRLWNATSWWIAPRDDINMRVPDEIKKCVVYFGLPSMKDGALVEMTFHATGFFAYVPFDELRGFLY